MPDDKNGVLVVIGKESHIKPPARMDFERLANLISGISGPDDAVKALRQALGNLELPEDLVRKVWEILTEHHVSYQ